MTKILFVCPDLNKPAGGIKQIYRQVWVLNKNNFNAYVLHGQKPFKANWFNTEVPVLWDYRVDQIDKPTKIDFKRQLINRLKIFLKAISSGSSLKGDKVELTKDDIIVLPEFYGKALDHVFPSQPTVIYNQNCYYSFRGYDFSKKNRESIYQQDRLKAVIVASIDALGYMRLFIKNKSLFRVKYGIDETVFSYSKNKKQQIAFMPRKLREDSVQVLSILHQKDILEGWTIKAIDGLNEFEVSKVLKESAIFLSFNHREGFGMPPAEAMACGCVVVGYAGQGGKEVLRPEFSFPIGDRDIKSFVEVLSDVLIAYGKDSEALILKGKKASEFVLSNYSMDKEEQTIIEVWNEILQLN